MQITNAQIAIWIEEYIQSPNATNVMNRKWEQMFIHRLRNDSIDDSGVACSQQWIAHINDKMEDLISRSNNFESLLNNIAELAKRFRGVKDLTTYDTATCIGCERGIYPSAVYLHAGTADGAKALGISGKKATKEQFVKICDAFEKLEPIQIEDFLCIYKYCLQGNILQCEKVRVRIKNNKACGTQRGCGCH